MYLTVKNLAKDSTHNYQQLSIFQLSTRKDEALNEHEENTILLYWKI
jgi:hypothetical protein